jgi:quinol monooxygenase YgiN
MDLALHALWVAQALTPERHSEKMRSRMATVISTLRIMTTLQSRAKVVRTLAAQLGAARAQPGCLRCDLYRDVEEQGAITLVEEWESQVDLGHRVRSEDYRVILRAIGLAHELPGMHCDTLLRRAGWEVIESARGQRRDVSQ